MRQVVALALLVGVFVVPFRAGAASVEELFLSWPSTRTGQGWNLQLQGGLWLAGEVGRRRGWGQRRVGAIVRDGLAPQRHGHDDQGSHGYQDRCGGATDQQDPGAGGETATWGWGA